MICLILCLFSVAFVACDDGRSPEEKAFTYPKKADTTYSNGGLAVRKGDYIYFVNGYKGVESDEHKQHSSYTHGALMLMKLGEDGNVVTDEDGLLEDDYYISMSNRLCGFEATGLYISGDYLYFTSPSKDNEYNGNNNSTWAKERVEFYRIKLDKTSGAERIYQSKIGFSELEYKYYEKDNQLYILVYENGTNLDNDDKKNTLVRVKCSNSSTREISTDISKVIMSDNGEDIFFSKTEDDTTIINRYNIFTDATVHFDSPTSEQFKELKLVSEDYVYITDENDELNRRSLKNGNSSWENLGYYVGHYDSLEIIPHSDNVLAIKGNRFEILNDDRMIVDSDAEKINFIGFTNGSVVYHDGDNNVKIMSYNDELSISTIGNVDSMSTNYFDVAEDDSYMYFFKTEGEHEYLYRLEVAFGEDAEAEMIGVYVGEDAPKAEDSEE